MHKRDYEHMAAVFAQKLGPDFEGLHTPQRTALLYDIAMQLAYVFKRDNPRFDRDRFLRACGFEEER